MNEESRKLLRELEETLRLFSQIGYKPAWQIQNDHLGLRVSTVSLPFEHGGGSYETCVFDDYGSKVVERYKTLDAASAGHTRHCLERNVPID